MSIEKKSELFIAMEDLLKDNKKDAAENESPDKILSYERSIWKYVE